MRTSKSRKIQEMDSEYRFDYEKAKPNRFAEKMNLNVGWTVEKFVEEVKEVKKRPSPNGQVKKAAPKTSSPKKKSMAKAKPAKKSPTKAKKKK